MNHRFAFIFISAIFCITLFAQRLDKRRIENLVRSYPDSLLKKITSGHLLNDTLYLKMLHEGWSREEVIGITDKFVTKNIKSEKGSSNYGRYAKQIKSYWANTISSDQPFIEDLDNQKYRLIETSIRKAFANADQYLPRKFYTPEDRLSGKRDKGRFRHVVVHPAGGRIHWIEVHPEDPDQLMVIPDGDAIWRTKDMGKTWDCVTDRIPNRFHRSVSNAYAIPVDPDDWNHFFAFMGNGNPVYETRDGGENWTQIQGAGHKGFKRGYVFRDARGKLKFIGANPNSAWNSSLWISEDTCKTWRNVVIPEAEQDIHPESGVKGFWFQEFAFDRSNKDLIYVPTSRSILRSRDGGTTFEKMKFKVYAPDGVTLRSDTTVFPLKATSPMFLQVNPNNTNQLWAALAVRNGNTTALYYSENKGESWITLHEPSAMIGKGTIFGNEAPWGWLGGFGLNFQNPQFVYGCSMSSAISSDGGNTFNDYAWGNRISGFYPDGALYQVACSRHNADNHCIVSHKSGRIFRGSDGGLFMKDTQINNNNWTNISGNMGQMLFYHSQVNEFGAQAIIGNTQDIDAQTYRRGRWGNWRGYEGSTAWMNPYSGEEHFSGGRGGGVQIQGQDYGSWSKGWAKADVCSGNWYLRRESNNSNGSRFSVIKDFGATSIPLDPIEGGYVRDFALARNTKQGTLYVLLNNYQLHRSDNQGETFVSMGRPSLIGTNTQLSFNTIAVNPDNEKEIYLGGRSLIYKSLDGGTSWINITDNLPTGMDVGSLFYHEGSGDLYLICPNHGIYLREANTTTWKLWMKGYNPAAFSNAEINYTTQEMMISDYGRGVWLADLEHPSDRYFKSGFNIKEISHTGGKRVFGIDTHWTIPVYYNYQWYINDQPVENANSQYLTADHVNDGDRIKLRLQVIESPDVMTESTVFTAVASNDTTLESKRGRYITSQEGRVDLGYVDLFSQDFTIDFWIAPQSDGVILANRQQEWCAAKGWFLRIYAGVLEFCYSPDHFFTLPPNEKNIKQDETVKGGRIPLGEWTHVAVTQQRDGQIILYVNGEKRGESTRIRSEYDLNNGLYLSLFADAYEQNPIKASVDELRIRKKAMNVDDVRKNMYAVRYNQLDSLVYRQTFDQDMIQDQKEQFSRQPMQVRTKAKMAFEPMKVSVAGEYAALNYLSDVSVLFTDKQERLAKISTETKGYNPQVLLVRYDNDFTFLKESTLNPLYHQVYHSTFGVRVFNSAATENDSVLVSLYLPKDSIMLFDGQRVYSTALTDNKRFWEYLADLKFNPTDSTLCFKTKMSDIDNKELALVLMKPAIELKVREINTRGVCEISSAEQNVFTVDGALISKLTEPQTQYSLKANDPSVKFSSPLYFIEGKAMTKFHLNTDSLSTLGSTKQIMIEGEDQKVIPFYLNLINRIHPKENKKYLKLTAGGAVAGSVVDYAAMNNSNTLSLSAWIRLDRSTMLQGLKPILMFRGGSSFGLHLQDGDLRCHWNEEGWSWSYSSGLRILPEQIGEWIHVALVSDPDGVTYYLNGKSHRLNRKLNPTAVLSGMMIGKNYDSDKYFYGAFDQISAWNRSLTHDEIHNLMHNRAINEQALISYVTFERTDESGNLLDTKTDKPVLQTGVTEIVASGIPYNSSLKYRVEGNNAAELSNVRITTPSDFSSFYYMTRFAKFPFNWTENIPSRFVPVEEAFYTIAFDKDLTANAPICYTHKSINPGDSLLLAMRPIGAETPFNTLTTSVATASGKVVFSQSEGQTKTMQFMFFIRPVSDNQPLRIDITGPQSEHVVLKDDETKIDLQTTYIAGKSERSVVLAVKEPYARIDSDTVSFISGMTGKHTLVIDRTRINPLARNPITITCQGAESVPLVFDVSLEPIVNLKLKNGTDELTVTTDRPIVDLEIEAELLQGVLDEKITFNTASQVLNSIMTTIGGLLSENSFKNFKLKHHQKGDKLFDAGWNLVGNPYLTKVNLTKDENVTFNNMTRFLYQYDADRKNFVTVDMSSYDEKHAIKPFGSYFVQTMSPPAILQIHANAKDKVLNKRNTRYLKISQSDEVQIELLSSGKVTDKTVISLQEGASDDFLVGEDAPKLWSLETTANQIYTLAGDKATSINMLSKKSKSEIPLAFKTVSDEPFQLRVSKIQITEDIKGIYLFDTKTGVKQLLQAGMLIDLPLDETVSISRYRIVVDYQIISNDMVDDVTKNYYVTVNDKTCTIHSLKGNAQIHILELNGRTLVNKKINASTFTIRSQAGVYLVNIKENGNVFTSKFIVK